MATLPAFAPVRPGQMVATIKIIPFAAPQAAVERCLAIASEAGPLVRVAPYRPLDVALIQTRLPGTKESMLDKTVAITAERITAAGGRLISEARCPPRDRGARRAHSGERRRSPADRRRLRDHRPARRAAGGDRGRRRRGRAFRHAGRSRQPAAARAGRRAHGPGPARLRRSPKLNGFDWVLERLAAGIPVDAAGHHGHGRGRPADGDPDAAAAARGEAPAQPGQGRRAGAGRRPVAAHGPGEQAAGAGRRPARWSRTWSTPCSPRAPTR